MQQQFLRFLQNLVVDANSKRFLLAVSGGRDSCVLAHLFDNAQLDFDIAHCNFHLRGEESNNEMLFVQNLSFLATKKFFVKEFDTYALQKESGKSIEMLARELRYEWFEEIGKDYDYIVTAHHANDNAETMIMNLLRGTGVRGMCGIPAKNGKIIRPLLKLTTKEIENYAIENKIEYCVDSSNLTDDFFRNKIRHHIIPELEKINPQVIETFTNNSNTFLKQTKFFDDQIHLIESKIVSYKKNKVFIDIQLLNKLDNKSVILFELLNKFGFNAAVIQTIELAINSNSGKLFFSDSHILLKDRGHLIIEEKRENNAEKIIIQTLEELESFGFVVEKIAFDGNFANFNDKSAIYVDVEKFQFPLTLRTWERGDIFYPFGMKSPKKVSDFFTDLKVNLLEKQKLKILCSQNKIVWIVNYRADNRFRIEENTEYYYKIIY